MIKKIKINYTTTIHCVCVCVNFLTFDFPLQSCPSIAYAFIYTNVIFLALSQIVLALIFI
jgi:hypothetical protein